MIQKPAGLSRRELLAERLPALAVSGSRRHQVFDHELILEPAISAQWRGDALTRTRAKSRRGAAAQSCSGPVTAIRPLRPPHRTRCSKNARRFPSRQQPRQALAHTRHTPGYASGSPQFDRTANAPSPALVPRARHLCASREASAAAGCFAAAGRRGCDATVGYRTDRPARSA